MILLIGLLSFVSSSFPLYSDDDHVSSAQHPNRRFLVEDIKIEEEEEENDEEETSSLNVLVVLCIVLLLILMTIAFELMKEHIEEHANKNFKPIIEKLFGEMTILGFLSLCTFCITQMGYFDILSNKLYHEHPHELLEIFEQIHFSIFFIMVFFVLQVLVLVREATETEQQWLDMDRQCRRSLVITTESSSQEQTTTTTNNNNTITQRRRNNNPKRSRWSMFCQLLLRLNNKQQDEDDRILFQALRHEFILDRSVEPPYAPQEQELSLQEFNFGRYLSMNLGTTLAHTVEVSIVTWTFFAVGTVLYAVLHMLLHYDTTALVWTWVGMGWFFFLFELFFEWHLLHVRDQFAAQIIIVSHYNNQEEEQEETNGGGGEVVTDQTPLLNEPAAAAAIATSSDGDDETDLLPGWTKVDLQEYNRSQRSWIAKFLVGGTPNRQQALYWADRKGPKVYLWILQGKLIFVGLYISVHFLEFFQHMKNDVSILQFVLYLVLSVLPILGIVFRAKHLVATLSQVSCLGTYRRPQIVASVLREEKISNAVRSFLVIYKLRKFAADASNIHVHYETAQPQQDGRPTLHYSASFDELERVQVGKTFDAFDLNGDGAISVDEIQQLMLSLDAPMMPSVLGAIVRRLDADGDNEVSRNEFLRWYSETMLEEDELSDHERAQFLFSIFDRNGSGEITIGEFKKRLDSLNAGFTVDEVGFIVNELDEDNSGTIGLEEFVHLIHQHYPHELRDSSQSSSSRNDNNHHH